MQERIDRAVDAARDEVIDLCLRRSETGAPRELSGLPRAERSAISFERGCSVQPSERAEADLRIGRGIES
jgi:hypothetical protein